MHTNFYETLLGCSRRYEAYAASLFKLPRVPMRTRTSMNHLGCSSRYKIRRTSCVFIISPHAGKSATLTFTYCIKGVAMQMIYHIFYEQQESAPFVSQPELLQCSCLFMQCFEFGSLSLSSEITSF